MHRLLIIAGVVGWVALCLAPWVAMEPNVWRIPAAIGLAPFALPIVLFGWFGEWGRSKGALRTLMPDFVIQAWDRS